ncbi:MAG TPA: chemotaxis protein CheW [Bryobacteraceae bacterium]|jgi:chemotaxis signal transduction protein|nr:chemotaxis protein CheW [Bryobacteraceae bacterium]
MSDAPRFDWQSALARLDKARRALEQGLAPAAEELEAIYRERAQRLAQGGADEPEIEAAGLLTVFRIDAFRYALPGSSVAGVLSGAKLAFVPGADPALMGVVQVRGEIRPVYNLLIHLQAQGSPPSGGPIILVNADRIQVGIAVTEVEEIRPFLKDIPTAAPESGAVSWVTEDFVHVLNPRALWRKRH